MTEIKLCSWAIRLGYNSLRRGTITLYLRSTRGRDGLVYTSRSKSAAWRALGGAGGDIEIQNSLLLKRQDVPERITLLLCREVRMHYEQNLYIHG